MTQHLSPMEVWSIASGSSGNAYLVRGEGATVLVECGISLSRVTGFLRRLGISPHDLTGVLLTHDHTDHMRSARQLSDTLRGADLRDTAARSAARRCAKPRWRARSNRSVRFGSATWTCMRVSGAARRARAGRVSDHGPGSYRHGHDRSGPRAWRGSAPPARQRPADPRGESRRRDAPERAISDLPEAASARASRPPVERGDRRGAGACRDRVPAEVWLAHLSPTNNRPPVALAAVTGRLQTVGLGHVTVRVAERHRPSLHWTADDEADSSRYSDATSGHGRGASRRPSGDPPFGYVAIWRSDELRCRNSGGPPDGRFRSV